MMNNLDTLLEPVKKQRHELLRDQNIEIVGVHISYDFSLQLDAAGLSVEKDNALLGYPVTIHRIGMGVDWEFQIIKHVLIADAPEKHVFGSK